MSNDRTMDVEACASCGEPTAVGTPLFSSRRSVETRDGARYLCSDCNGRLERRHGRRAEDDELRRFIDNGSIIAMAWRE